MKSSIAGMTVMVMGVVLAAPSAIAYENYIPLGTGYSSNVDSLPEFDSNAGEVARKTDTYETELYLKNRKSAEEDSRFRKFFSDRNSTGLNEGIDY